MPWVALPFTLWAGHWRGGEMEIIDDNCWWKLLMKIVDENYWWTWLIKIVDQNYLMEIIDQNYLIEMIDQNDSQGIRHLGMSPCASENLTVLELDNCPLITDLRWAMIIFHQSHPCQNIHSQSQNCRLKELLTLAKHAKCANCWLLISYFFPALTTWWAAIISRELSCEYFPFKWI